MQLQGVKNKFNSANRGKQVSLADLIVLGGAAAIEKAAKDAGINISVPFSPGRVDATQNNTDVETFAYRMFCLMLHHVARTRPFHCSSLTLLPAVEPQADGFRNYGHGDSRSLTEEILVDKAALLTLSPPEMTVLVGGMRALDANYDGSPLGILTDRPGQLTSDFFVNLLNISTVWSPVANTNDELYQGNDLNTGKPKYTATRADLIFGSHPELRAVAEVYGSGDAQQKFVNDFVSAWAKVMDLDRYDIKGRKQNNVQ